MNAKIKKLSLNKETLKSLSPEQLDSVDGATGVPCWFAAGVAGYLLTKGLDYVWNVHSGPGSPCSYGCNPGKATHNSFHGGK